MGASAERESARGTLCNVKTRRAPLDGIVGRRTPLLRSEDARTTERPQAKGGRRCRSGHHRLKRGTPSWMNPKTRDERCHTENCRGFTGNPISRASPPRVRRASAAPSPPSAPPLEDVRLALVGHLRCHVRRGGGAASDEAVALPFAARAAAAPSASVPGRFTHTTQGQRRRRNASSDAASSG